MTRRLPTLLKSSPRLAAILLLTLFLTSICMTPSEVYAKRSVSLTDPGGGGGPALVPGQGDDDEPTADGSATIGRWTASVSDPNDTRAGGGLPERKFTSLRVAKTLIVRSWSFVKRLVVFVP